MSVGGRSSRSDRTQFALLSYDDRAGLWTVAREFTVDAIGRTFVVRRGTRSNLASVPRWFWWIVAPFELSIAGALFHDECYATGGYAIEITDSRERRRVWLTRARVDRAFYELMTAAGVWWWRRWLAYHAVRLFGGRHWRDA